MDCCNQTTYKEGQAFPLLLQSIFCSDAAVQSSYSFGKYQLTVQEFFPLKTDQNLFPLKSLILQQLPENESSVTSQNYSSRRTDSDNLDSSIEWTGCPLEASFLQASSEISNDTFNTTPSIPSNMKKKWLSLSKARSFLSTYNICFGGKKNAYILPLWIPCDPNNSEHISWIGAYCNEDMNSRAVIISSGRLMGKSLPSLDDIKKKHFLGKMTDFQKTETKVFASYNLADKIDTVENNSHQSDYIPGIPVTIHCFSNKPTETLNILGEDAKCNILLKINSDSDKSSSYMICRDLELIKMLVSGMKNNEVLWPPKLTDCDTHAKIQRLLESLKYRSFEKASSKNISNVSTCQMNSPFLETRQELDFTDELWNILKQCSSYEELQNNIDFVIETLRTGEVQPVIFRNNSTYIGTVVKSLQHGDFEVNLKGKSALDMLIETGLEKLRRDFMYIFFEHELATQSQLLPFVKSDLSFTKSILEMTKLHKVLKIVSACRTALHLPTETVKLFARKALAYYNEMESENTNYVFDFPISYTSIRKITNSLKPAQWQISFKTTTTLYVSHTICCLSQSSNIHSDQYCSDSDSPTPALTSNYYCTQAQLIQDFLYCNTANVRGKSIIRE